MITFIRKFWRKIKTYLENFPPEKLIPAYMAATLFLVLAVFIAYWFTLILGKIGLGLVLLAIFLPEEFWQMLWQRITKQGTAAVSYPVYFGSNGSRIVPALVDEAFQDIYACFAACYFDTYWTTPSRNCIIYRFVCCPKPGIDDRYSLTELVQKKAERLVAGSLREAGISVPCEDAVTVRLEPSHLLVAFACNANGIREIISWQENSRREQLKNALHGQQDLREEWDTNHE